jgi:hypothetical protein
VFVVRRVDRPAFFGRPAGNTGEPQLHGLLWWRLWFAALELLS